MAIGIWSRIRAWVRRFLRRRWPHVFVKSKDLNEVNVRQIRHALRRAEERFGVRLTKREYWELVRRIQDGETVPCLIPARTGKYTKFHWVRLPNGRTAIAVYTKRAKLIKSFYLPLFRHPHHEQPFVNTLGEHLQEALRTKEGRPSLAPAEYNALMAEAETKKGKGMARNA